LGPKALAQAGRTAATAYSVYRGLSVPLRSSIYRGLQSSTYGYAAALEERYAISASRGRWRTCSRNGEHGSVQRGVPLSGVALGKIVRRGLLYVGLAVASLTAFALVFALLVYTGHTGRLSGGWVGLAVYTCGLFWVTIRQSREYWRRQGFWLAIGGLLVVHLLAFIAILHAYPQWRMIWFWPIVIVEGGLFGAILYLLFGERKHH
jgi:hypothetical protein